MLLNNVKSVILRRSYFFFNFLLIPLFMPLRKSLFGARVPLQPLTISILNNKVETWGSVSAGIGSKILLTCGCVGFISW